MYIREIEAKIQDQIKKGKSVFLLGPRQVGKTTLCRKLRFDLEINLASNMERLKFEKDPERLEKLVSSQKQKLLIYIDEVQKVPTLFNSIQALIDSKKAQFLLTGSSTRKIKKDFDFNYAPGRLIHFKMDPLTYQENKQSLENIFSNGQLPGICILQDYDQQNLEFRSYVEAYIEEEIRKETRLRQIAPFARFIEMAALQSGKICNYTEISKELGPTVVTIQSYYQILVDTLFAERIPPYLKNASRKKLTKSSRYLFFDMGVRRILADESSKFNPERRGELFEHWIGNEILKWIHIHCPAAKLYFWRDSDGPVVDWLIEYDGRLLPIEVKLKSNPDVKAAKHLKVFLNEYKSAAIAWVVCSSDIKYKIEDRVYAIPYMDLVNELNKWKK